MKSLFTQASLGNAQERELSSRAAPAKVVSACANNCATGNTVMLIVVAPGIELGYVEQRAEQFVHRGQRRLDAADDLTALAGAQLAVELRDEEAQSMERLTQIVTGRSDKTRLCLVGVFELTGALFDFTFQAGVGFLQPGGHGVELIAQCLEFVAGID